MNKRELKLLMLLGLVIVGFLYYKFIVTPLDTHIAEAHVQKQDSQEQVMEMKTKLASEKVLDQEILKYNTELSELSDTMFGTLEQEDIMNMIDAYAMEHGVTIESLEFVELEEFRLKKDKKNSKNNSSETNEQKDKVEDSMPEHIATLSRVKLQYQAEYQPLMNLMKAFKVHSKRVGITNFQTSNIENGILRGKMNLVFYSAPVIEEYAPSHYGNMAVYVDPRNTIKLEHPFVYANFVDDEEHVPWTDEYIIEEVEPEELEVVEEIEQEVWTRLYEFSDSKYFFVGTPREVNGSVVAHTPILDTKPVANMQYHFMKSRSHSAANLVFDHEAVILPKQPQALRISYYSLEENQHSTGIVLRDSGGHEYKIPFKHDGKNQGELQQVRMELPAKITYPAIVQRIYAESEDREGKLNGEFWFSQIDALYPNTNENLMLAGAIHD